MFCNRASPYLHTSLFLSPFLFDRYSVLFCCCCCCVRCFALVLLKFSPMPTDLYAMDFWFSIQHAYIIYVLHINKFSHQKNIANTVYLFTYFEFLFFTHDTSISCYIQKCVSKLICEVRSFISFGYSNANARKHERYLTKRWQLKRFMKSVATTMFTFSSSQKCYEVCFHAIFEAFFKWTLHMDTYHISLE